MHGIVQRELAQTGVEGEKGEHGTPDPQHERCPPREYRTDLREEPSLKECRHQDGQPDKPPVEQHSPADAPKETFICQAVFLSSRVFRFKIL